MQDRRNIIEERENAAVRLLHAPVEERDVLLQEYKERSLKAFAPSTRRNLLQILRSFDDWCIANGYSSLPPVDPRVVAAYVDYLGGRIRPTTIELRLWAISENHRANFLSSPCHHRLVELALKAVKRTYGATVRQAPPLGKREILAVIANLGDKRIDVRDRALLWIATDSWCRASEIVELRVCDLCQQDDGSGLLFIRRSKTDQYGQGAYAFLSRNGVLAARRWIEVAGLRLDDPLITKHQPRSKRAPMDPATISRILKRRTGRSDVSAHSTRVGGVHDALTLGCDLTSIMVAGRWNSPEMPARYGRRILASKSAAAVVSKAFE